MRQRNTDVCLYADPSLCRLNTYLFVHFAQNTSIMKIFFCICVSGALQITESDVSDQGKYECVANNSVGTEYSKSITLYVKRMLAWLL